MATPEIDDVRAAAKEMVEAQIRKRMAIVETLLRGQQAEDALAAQLGQVQRDRLRVVQLPLVDHLVGLGRPALRRVGVPGLRRDLPEGGGFLALEQIQRILRSPRNLAKVSGARWNRGLAALTRLYRWAVRREFVTVNPIEMQERLGRYGEVVETPAARSKDARASNVHWLTPRMFRLWVNVGLRGHTAQGLVGPVWVGRLEDRNAAVADFLLCSGLRLTEGASLLTLELPSTALDGGKYYPARLGRKITKSKKARTFYISAQALVQIQAYVQAGRAAAIRRAQARDLYDGLPELRVVTRVTGFRKKILRWYDRDGVEGQTALSDATLEERLLLVPGDDIDGIAAHQGWVRPVEGPLPVSSTPPLSACSSSGCSLGRAPSNPRCSGPSAARIAEKVLAPRTIRCSSPYKARRRSRNSGPCLPQ